MKESGLSLEHPIAARIRNHVSVGHWNRVSQSQTAEFYCSPSLLPRLIYSELILRSSNHRSLLSSYGSQLDDSYSLLCVVTRGVSLF